MKLSIATAAGTVFAAAAIGLAAPAFAALSPETGSAIPTVGELKTDDSAVTITTVEGAPLAEAYVVSLRPDGFAPGARNDTERRHR